MTARKFKLLQIEDELMFLQSKEFPLPESLSEDQWSNLMSLKEEEFRTRYINLIHSEIEDIEEQLETLKKEDEKAFEVNSFNSYMFLIIF